MTKIEKARIIVERLDEIARDYDRYEYWLPTMARQKQMQDAILSII